MSTSAPHSLLLAVSPVAFNPLPVTGFLRLSEVLRLYPVAKSTWWAGVKSGRYPKPVKLGERCTAWRVEDIRALIEAAGKEAA
ncbi:MAG TPA: transcriptional regulator [Xanthomonadaceae bacterium]|nr:transcriptional regulator [Xanthomonadaceae bacterium]